MFSKFKSLFLLFKSKIFKKIRSNFRGRSQILSNITLFMDAICHHFNFKAYKIEVHFENIKPVLIR